MAEHLKILRRREVEAKTGLSRATIYDKTNPKCKWHDPAFPTQVNLGTKAVGWIEHEIDEWIATQIKKSRKATRKGQS